MFTTILLLILAFASGGFYEETVATAFLLLLGSDGTRLVLFQGLQDCDRWGLLWAFGLDYWVEGPRSGKYLHFVPLVYFQLGWKVRYIFY